MKPTKMSEIEALFRTDAAAAEATIRELWEQAKLAQPNEVAEMARLLGVSVAVARRILVRRGWVKPE
jgi:hypothetical protein